MTDDEIKSTLRRIQSNIRVTKVVATRSVKGKGGDTYAGFSAAWNTVQDDAGGGIDALLSDTAEAQSGMTLREARVAHLMVAMQADLAAHDAALAGGNISNNYHREAHRGIKANYSRMIREVFAGAPQSDKPE
ncbi:MAG: hypothetical protein EBT79_06410 [Actinobacteria bacterium]|nr:hypothetical protein [Actinomycetota bacterium]NBR66901.1 hypothetical protein [Actinomycetota bacterium]